MCKNTLEEAERQREIILSQNVIYFPFNSIMIANAQGCWKSPLTLFDLTIVFLQFYRGQTNIITAVTAINLSIGEIVW